MKEIRHENQKQRKEEEKEGNIAIAISYFIHTCKNV